jgi:membrane protein YdbS with pleckstrin-like domain
MQYKRLGWKTFWIFVSDRSQAAIAIGLVAFAFSLFSSVPLMASIARVLITLFFLALVATIAFSWLEYRNWQYRLDSDSFMIKKGIIRIEETAIPYRHIEDADIERDILNRLTGTASLVIITAGHTDEDKERASTEAEIPIIDLTLALALQSELARRSNVQKVEEVAPLPMQ